MLTPFIISKYIFVGSKMNSFGSMISERSHAHTNCSAVMPWYVIKPIAANGAAARTHIHASVSMPAYGLSRKYSKTATPQANKEKTNCRSDSPKNNDSV